SLTRAPPPPAPSAPSRRWCLPWKKHAKVRDVRRRELRRKTSKPESRSRYGGLPKPKRVSRTFPRSCARWRGLASRDSPETRDLWKWTRRLWMRPVTSSACNVGRNRYAGPCENTVLPPPLRQLLEPQLPLQPRPRTFLSAL